MPKVHPNNAKSDTKSKRLSLLSKSSESKEESSESEESIYNSWKSKLKRLKRNSKRNKNNKDKDKSSTDSGVSADDGTNTQAKKCKTRKKMPDKVMVDWESKTPFVFTFSGISFPPIAEAEEAIFVDDPIEGKTSFNNNNHRDVTMYM